MNGWIRAMLAMVLLDCFVQVVPMPDGKLHTCTFCYNTEGTLIYQNCN